MKTIAFSLHLMSLSIFIVDGWPLTVRVFSLFFSLSHLLILDVYTNVWARSHSVYVCVCVLARRHLLIQLKKKEKQIPSLFWNSKMIRFRRLWRRFAVHLLCRQITLALHHAWARTAVFFRRIYLIIWMCPERRIRSWCVRRRIVYLSTTDFVYKQCAFDAHSSFTHFQNYTAQWLRERFAVVADVMAKLESIFSIHIETLMEPREK